MNFRACFRVPCLLSFLLCITYSTSALSGYRTYLDPRSMAMGGTGVASATKFNASSHNPALIAFNKGTKPDKIYFNVSMGTRDLYNENLNDDIIYYQDNQNIDELSQKFSIGTDEEITIEADKYKNLLREIDQSSYRTDELFSYSLLVDTSPITINFFSRREIRTMTTILDLDKSALDDFLDMTDELARLRPLSLSSSVQSTYFEIKEFGVTVATTNVIDYNMPISWGFSPKLIEFHSGHSAVDIKDYDVANPPDRVRPSESNLEWNVDVGFAMLFTDDFLQNEFGLDGEWLKGEWVFGFSGMNLFPTDIQSYGIPNRPDAYPRSRPALQAIYQVGLAHYREKFMVTMDIELTEDEVFTFEGTTRFISLGGEYYWRRNFHLRGGLRINASQTDGSAKEKATISTGFMYEPHGFTFEGAFMFSDVEVGGTMGFGIAF